MVLFSCTACQCLDIGALGELRGADIHALSFSSRSCCTGSAPASWAFHRTCCCALPGFVAFAGYRWPSPIQTPLIRTSWLPFMPSSFQENDVLSINFEKIASVTITVYLRLQIQIWFNVSLFKTVNCVKYCGLRYNPNIFDNTKNPLNARNVCLVVS